MWIISDLHISTNFSLIEMPEIIKVLSYILKQEKDEIIFNGDTFDFARSSSIPEGYSATKTETKYGITPSTENAARKMQMIIDSNDEFFNILKLMIDNGFKLIFLYGNHDSELRYNSVQEVIKRRIGGVCGENLCYDIRYIKDGKIIEHGHQYDPENRIVYSNDFYSEEYTFGYVTSKYFGNIIEREKRLPKNDASAGEYFLWVFKNFGIRSIRFIFQYFLYAFIVISRSGRWFRYRKEISDEPLIAEPLMSSLFKTIKRLYFVQVFLFIFLIIASTISFILFSSLFPYAFILLCLCLIPLFGINNKRRLKSIFDSVSLRLKEIYNAKQIIFGHDHYYSHRDAKSSYLSSVPFEDEYGLYILWVKSDQIIYERVL